ncbi:RNA-binding domain-containing protein [Nemania serpens]|nr:RNA-binding domain-containing protein [Nemania serpens]
MDYQSPSRDGPGNSRSPTPASRYSASPSPRGPRYPSASPPPADADHNGDYRSPESRSPSRGRGDSRSPLRGSTKIVVEKLSKTINEDHLYEIFGQYGAIRDLDLPMSRQSGTNRGTAYILYVNEADADAAIASMHEANVDGAIINVSIVLPRRKFNPSPPTASRGANIDPRNSGPGFRGGLGRGAGGMGSGGGVGGGGAGGGGRGFGFGGARGGHTRGLDRLLHAGIAVAQSRTGLDPERPLDAEGDEETAMTTIVVTVNDAGALVMIPIADVAVPVLQKSLTDDETI